jgi:hypothetical protein
MEGGGQELERQQVEMHGQGKQGALGNQQQHEAQHQLWSLLEQ